MRTTPLLLLLPATLLACHAVPAAAASRLEEDFHRQRSALQLSEKLTDEGACGGPPVMAVYRSGHEIRVIRWECETSTAVIRREYYFSRGVPQLAIEKQWLKFDHWGNLRPEPSPRPARRVWFHEPCTGSRREFLEDLRGHVAALIRFDSTPRTPTATPTPPASPGA